MADSQSDDVGELRDEATKYEPSDFRLVGCWFPSSLGVVVGLLTASDDEPAISLVGIAMLGIASYGTLIASDVSRCGGSLMSEVVADHGVA